MGGGTEKTTDHTGYTDGTLARMARWPCGAAEGGAAKTANFPGILGMLGILLKRGRRSDDARCEVTD